MDQHRRCLLRAGAGFLAAAGFPALAQSQGRVFTIGFLANHIPRAELERPSSPSPSSATVLMDGMRKLGWVEGRNIRMVWRSAESDYTRHAKLVQELIAIPVDVIVTFSEGVNAAARATKTIPIVFGDHVRPVADGLIASLSRPGGNVTGIASSTGAELGKSLGLMKEVVPNLKRVAIVAHSIAPDWLDRMPAPHPSPSLQALFKSLDLDVFFLGCRDPSAIEAVVRGAVLAGAGAIWVEPNFGMYKDPSFARRLGEAAIRHRMPVMQGNLQAFDENGGLMAHGIDYYVGYRRLSHYVDRILRGDKPGDIPVEQPMRVEFRVNLKAAAAIGLKVPAAALLQADRVIE